MQRLLLIAALLLVTAGSAAASGAPISKARYVAKIHAGEQRAARADASVAAALASKSATAAQVRARYRAWGASYLVFATELARLTPPRRAREGNADLVVGARRYGRELQVIAAKMPRTRAGIVRYLQGKNPFGGLLVANALRELRAAGFGP